MSGLFLSRFFERSKGVDKAILQVGLVKTLCQGSIVPLLSMIGIYVHSRCLALSKAVGSSCGVVCFGFLLCQCIDMTPE